MRQLNESSKLNQYCSLAVKCESGKEFNISLVYRSPNSSSKNNNLFFEFIANHPSNSLIVGDFNLPKIDWTTNTADAKGLLEIIEERNLIQPITFT